MEPQLLLWDGKGIRYIVNLDKPLFRMSWRKLLRRLPKSCKVEVHCTEEWVNDEWAGVSGYRDIKIGEGVPEIIEKRGWKLTGRYEANGKLIRDGVVSEPEEPRFHYDRDSDWFED